METNFIFLKKQWPMLATLGQLAEKNIYQDSNTTLIKLGMFAEQLVEYMFAYDNVEEPVDKTQANRVRVLKQNGLLPYEIDQILYTLRKARNKAAHDGYQSVDDAKTNTSLTFKLAVWFKQIYDQWDFVAPKYVEPKEVKERDVIDQIKQESETISKQYEEELKKLKSELDDYRNRATALATTDRKEKIKEGCCTY